ncbi:hypothetical protein ACFO1B_24060 [Dactylosporangium siamense]
MIPTVPAPRLLRNATLISATSTGRSTSHDSGRCSAGTNSARPCSYHRCDHHPKHPEPATAAVDPANHRR